MCNGIYKNNGILGNIIIVILRERIEESGAKYDTYTNSATQSEGFGEQLPEYQSAGGTL